MPNMVALGTDTTGAYVQSIALHATTPGISLTQSAVGAESNVITALKVDNFRCTRLSVLRPLMV